MQITKAQMQAISALLTKEDLQLIAKKSEMSVRTVESVKQSLRQTDIIQKWIFKIALGKWNDMGKTLNAIQLNNTEFANIHDYKAAKASSIWQTAREYDRFMDIYLQLSSTDWKDINELWKKLKDDFNDILQLQYYCIDIIVRVMGITPDQAIKYYNQLI